MKNVPSSIWFIAALVPLTAFASWHAGQHGHSAQASLVPHRSRPPILPDDTSRALGWIPPQEAARWECIVIHHSATELGGAGRFDRAHRDKGWAELGYHFVIGNGTDTEDGEIEVGPRWTEQTHGAHCYTKDEYYNNHGIGICLVGNFDHHQPSYKQMQSLSLLTRYLCRRYDLPSDCVYVHGDITGKTRCPGEHFDLEAIRAAVRGDE